MLSLQQFINYSLGFSTPVLVPRKASAAHNENYALISCDSLYPLVGLSNFGGSNLSCDLAFMMYLRRLVDFSVCLTFCHSGGVMASKLLTFQAGNWASHLFFRILKLLHSFCPKFSLHLVEGYDSVLIPSSPEPMSPIWFGNKVQQIYGWSKY